MRRRDTYWSLYHKGEKRQLDDLKTDAIEIVYDVLPVKDRGDWLLWREGFATWKPLDDFPNLLQALRRGGMMNGISQPPPQPVPSQPIRGGAAAVHASAASASPVASAGTITDSKPVMLGHETKSTNKPETTVQDRLNRQGTMDSAIELDLLADYELGDRAARYPKRWQVRILTDGKPILLTTIDASNRGFSLKESLPKNLPRYFNVEIVTTDMVIPMICSAIETANGAPSTRIRIEVNDDPSLLQAALLQ